MDEVDVGCLYAEMRSVKVNASYPVCAFAVSYSFSCSSCCF